MRHAIVFPKSTTSDRNVALKTGQIERKRLDCTSSVIDCCQLHGVRIVASFEHRLADILDFGSGQ